MTSTIGFHKFFKLALMIMVSFVALQLFYFDPVHTVITSAVIAGTFAIAAAFSSKNLFTTILRPVPNGMRRIPIPTTIVKQGYRTGRTASFTNTKTAL